MTNCELIREKMSEDPEVIREAAEEELRKASKELGVAISDLEDSCDSVYEACKELEGTTVYDRLHSVLSEMEETLVGLKAMKKNWKEGNP